MELRRHGSWKLPPEPGEPRTTVRGYLNFRDRCADPDSPLRCDRAPRVLRWCAVATSLGAIGAAFSRSLIAFTLCELILNAAASAAIAAGVVVLPRSASPLNVQRARALPGSRSGGKRVHRRADADLAYGGYSWRWLLVLAATANLGYVWSIARTMKLRVAASCGESRRGGVTLSDLMRPRYRRHAITFVVSALLGSIAITSSKSWIYFHRRHDSRHITCGGERDVLIAGDWADGLPAWGSVIPAVRRVPTVSGFALLLALARSGRSGVPLPIFTIRSFGWDWASLRLAWPPMRPVWARLLRRPS